MKLIYRGVPYSGDKLKSTAGAVSDRPAIRQEYVKAISPHFPCLQYLKQLFQRSESKIIDPITFWYRHKRQYLNFCLFLNELEALERCWYLTLINERHVKPARPIKLKYRGITYYR